MGTSMDRYDNRPEVKAQIVANQRAWEALKARSAPSVTVRRSAFHLRQAERLAYAHWFASEGYRDQARRIWWCPGPAPLPSAFYVFGAVDCICYDGGIAGTDTLCKYCKGKCPTPPGVLPPDESQAH